MLSVVGVCHAYAVPQSGLVVRPPNESVRANARRGRWRGPHTSSNVQRSAAAGGAVMGGVLGPRGLQGMCVCMHLMLAPSALRLMLVLVPCIITRLCRAQASSLSLLSFSSSPRAALLTHSSSQLPLACVGLCCLCLHVVRQSSWPGSSAACRLACVCLAACVRAHALWCACFRKGRPCSSD